MATRGLSLVDLEAPEAKAQEAEVLGQALTAAKHRLELEDLFPEVKTKEEPFEGGSTLKATVPLPGEWPTVDTGVPIGKKTAQFLAGAGKRFSDVQSRAKQGMNALSGNTLYPGIQDEIDRAAIRDADLLATTPGMVGHFTPDMLASIGIGPLANTRRGAGVMGAVQGALNPVTSNEKNGTVLNAGIGAIAGAGGQALSSGLAKGVGKVLHAAPEVIPDSARRLAQRQGVELPSATWTDPEKRRLYLLAKSKGVPITIGDLDPTSEWASTENAMRPFWSGRSSSMQKQQDATRQVLTDLRDGIATIPEGSESAAIEKGVKDKLAAAKQVASDKFQLVGDIAGRSPNLTPIKPTTTYLAVRSALADYPDLFDEFKNSGQISKLLGLSEDVGPQAGLIINPQNNKPFKYPAQIGFDDAQFLRKRLGAWYDKLNGQLRSNTLPAGIDGEAVKHAATIFGSLNKDLDAWGRQPGNKALNDAWADARNYFKTEVLPFRDPSRLDSKSKLIQNIVNDNVDVDALANKALPLSETSVAGDVMKHSTPIGQQGLKSALIRKIVDPSISEDLQGLGNVSLLKNTRKGEHIGKDVFSAKELQNIQDARDIADLTRRSAEAGTTPPATGARTLPFMAGSALLGTAGTTYMGLGMLGDAIDPATRIALSTMVAPVGVLGTMNALNKYTGSALGKNLHFADPELKGALGIIQEAARRAGRGAAEPLADSYVHDSLGHRR